LGNELKKLFKHGGTYAFASILQRSIGFILIPVYTHYLSTADYGILQLVAITIEIIGIIVSLGIADAVFRFYYDTDDPERRRKVISTAYIGVFFTATTIIGILSLFSWKTAGWILEASNQGIYIFIALMTLYFNTLDDLFYTFLRVKERSVFYLIFSVLRTATGLSLIIYFIVFLGKGLMGIFLGNLLASIMLAAFAIPYLLSQSGYHFSPSIAKKMLRYGIPIIPANLASFVVNASDRYFIRGYLSIADVGIYTLGYRLGNIIHYFVRVPFMQIWSPRRFALYREGAPPQTFAKITTYFIGLMIFSGLGISIFVHDFIKLISPPEYWSAAIYTPAIALCYVLYSLDNHVALGILIEKKTEYWSYVNFGMAGLNLFLNYALISRYGIWGAVLSTFTSIFFKIFALHLFGRRFFAIPFEWSRMLGFLLLAILTYLLRTAIHPFSLELAFLWDSFLVITYLILLWILGLVRTEEKKALKEVLRRSYSMIKLKMLRASKST